MSAYKVGIFAVITDQQGVELVNPGETAIAFVLCNIRNEMMVEVDLSIEKDEEKK